MESQAETQSYPPLLRPDYQPEQLPLANALYTQRDCNDRILGQTLNLIQKNRGLAKRIDELKKTTPGFLSSWWESSVDPSDIPTMINKVQIALVQQMEAMNAVISQDKAYRQTEAVELEKQQQEQQSLLKLKEELENQLKIKVQNNDRYQDELKKVLGQDHLFDSIKELQQCINFFQQQKYFLSFETNKIKASFPNDSQEEAIRKYFQQVKALIIHLIEYREQCKESLDQANGQLDKTNRQIERYEHESRVNQVRKQNIVNQHVELKRLKEQLVYREDRRKQAERKKAQLERTYCQKEMENVTGEYQSLQRKFDNLVGKSMDLVRKMTKKTQLQALERVINQQSQN